MIYCVISVNMDGFWISKYYVLRIFMPHFNFNTLLSYSITKQACLSTKEVRGFVTPVKFSICDLDEGLLISTTIYNTTE